MARSKRGTPRAIQILRDAGYHCELGKDAWVVTAMGAGSQRCAGQTQEGERCELLTRDPDGFCHVHAGQANGGGE